MKPLNKDQLDELRRFLTKEKKARDLALLNTGIDTMLRSSDLLSLTVNDVIDHLGAVREELIIRKRKTQTEQVVALNTASRTSLTEWIQVSQKSPSDFLWTSIGHRRTGRPITREHYATMVKSWCRWIGLDPRRYSTHSIRRSKSTAIYTSTHNLKACQILLGHKNIASTAHYLNFEQCEELDLAKQLEL